MKKSPWFICAALACLLLLGAVGFGFASCGHGTKSAAGSTSTSLVAGTAATTSVWDGSTTTTVTAGSTTTTTTSPAKGSTTTATKAGATTTIRGSSTTTTAKSGTTTTTTTTKSSTTTTTTYTVTVEGSFGRKVFTLGDLHKLPVASSTIYGKTGEGPKLSVVLDAAGVNDFTKVTLHGYRGSTDVLTKAQANASDCIFDFTNRGTVKIMTTAYASSDLWTKDVYLVAVQ